MEDMPITTQIALWAFGAGLLFGATAQKTNFCTMGAISDMMLMGDKGRFRAWMLAIAVAILGTQTMAHMELIQIDSAIYRTTNLGWLGAILGGLLFGYGMTLGGGCGNKTLVRVGGGNLKSLVVFLVMGFFAYMTVRGLTGLARVNWIEVTNVDLSAMEFASQGMDTLLAGFLGVETGLARWIVTAVFAGGLLIYVFKDRQFLSEGNNIAGGVIIGLLVPFGWYITGVITFDDFEPQPLTSFTFVAPIGESMMYLMAYTGSTINFGIAAVGGVIAGSFLMSVATKSFHIEGFNSAGDTAQNLIGAAMMGVGGVLALGCTIGQGITGMSTLAFGSLLALVSIVFGGMWGIKAFEEDSIMGGLKAVFARD